MRTDTMIRSALAFGLALSIAAVAPAQEPAAQDAVGSVVIEAASVELPGGDVPYEIGTLSVPENRSNPESRRIGVGFARFEALSPSETPPLFLLPGGPGGSFIERLRHSDEERRERFVSWIRRFQRVGEVVIVDQRGFSERGEKIRAPYQFPVRRIDQPATEAQVIDGYRDFARAAVAQFEGEETDLSGYTVKQCAADVNDLRAALGYEKITLVGTSFGSQWSFAVMRLFPDSVARALLSGVEPLDHGFDMPSYVFAALQRMWTEIEKDERFGPYLPEGGIAAALESIRGRLDQGPIRLNEPDDDGTAMLLGTQDLTIWDPAMILELYHGHHDRWRQRVARSALGGFANGPLIGPLIDSSLGVTPQRRHRLWTDPATRYLGRRNFALYLATAEIWPSPDVGDDFRTPMLCDIPVVFAQGDWDTSTPLENTFEIAPYFPRSRVVVAERGGHGVLGPIADELPEVWRELEEFLRTGDSSGIPARVRLRPSRRFDPPTFELPERP